MITSEKEHQKIITALFETKKEIEKELFKIKLPAGHQHLLDMINEQLENSNAQLQDIKIKVETNKNLIKNSKKNEKNVKEHKEKATKLRHQLSLVEFWITGFSEIKRNIIDNFIPTLEKKVNENIKTAGMDFNISLNTLRELKSGQMKQEFNITVLDSLGNERPANSFSAGERKTQAICLALAISDYKQEIGLMPFGFRMFDEVADGLDGVGQQQFAELLKKRQEQNIVISHSDYLEDSLSSKITVIKENGVSRI